MEIDSGDQVWFWYDEKEYSGYVRPIKGDLLEISVYYIDGVALGYYEIVGGIAPDDICRFEKRKMPRSI